MLSLVYFYLIYYILHFSLYGLFKKAGKNPIHCFFPFLQDKTWLEILGKNPNKAFWGLIPYVNVLFALTWVTDTMNCFGKTAFWQHFIATFFGFLYFPVMGFDKETKYIGPLYADNQKVKRSAPREWADAILFAIVAASFVRMFVIEAYKIPTTSMEGSLLAGDYLFVSKLNYGARTPMTPIAFPFAHHTMPLVNTKAYTTLLHFGYHRLPGFERIERGDVVVFNYPGDATDFPERPIDKRENYVKRCVALPGDILEVKDRELFINGKKQDHFSQMQFSYTVKTKLSPSVFEQLGLNWFNDILLRNYSDQMGNPIAPREVIYNDFVQYISSVDSLDILLTASQYEQLKAMPNIISVTPTNMSAIVNENDLFPKNPNVIRWHLDNYGPLIIPKKGWTIPLTVDNLARYGFTIREYEKQDISINGNEVRINGQPVTQYTFNEDYYFMMGDNRHNSLDSRYWGFVPEDHVVGKPLFVWLSKNNFEAFPQNIKWKRMFRSVSSLCQ